MDQSIKIGDLIACYVPTFLSADGIDLGVVLERMELSGEPFLKVEWIHGGTMREPLRIAEMNRILYLKVEREINA